MSEAITLTVDFLTQADQQSFTAALAKAATPREQPLAKPAKTRGAVGWLLFAGLCVLLFLYLQSHDKDAARTPRQSATQKQSWIHTPYAVMAIGGYAWVGITFVIIRRMQNTPAKMPVAYSFSEEAVQVEAAEVLTRWQWQAFDLVLETHDLIILRTASTNGLMIPKRAIPDNDVLQQLRELIGRHTPPPLAEQYRGFEVVQ